MQLSISGLAIMLTLFSLTEAKIFQDNCELVQALRPFNLPNDLQNWVCLIMNESAKNTKAINKNKNGSIDYGLFQINSRYWCRQTRAGGDCKQRCKEFLKDDITDAVNCAKKIYKRHGFNAWYGWKNHCQGKPLPDISKC